ncbi:unnamed protein product [Mytilus coruscus]|uniref:Uncharacterized protein n=1 Tax=Mytilus coruscus TaxID=42192 RepID=A0A6J8CEX4_MYTCO|nr:unnamed protein product [Mytilus coruscus]
MDMKIVELLASPEASSPSKHEPTCDKAKTIPNGNRQVLPEKIIPLKDLNAVVGANAEHLQGALYQKHRKLVEQVLGRWAKKAKYVNNDKPGMLQLVQEATKQKLIGLKKHKDSKEDVITEIPATKRTNGNKVKPVGRNPTTKRTNGNKVKPVGSPEQKRKLSSSSILSKNKVNAKMEYDKDSLSESYNGPDSNDSNV